jgi:hypothetical protein
MAFSAREELGIACDEAGAAARFSFFGSAWLVLVFEVFVGGNSDLELFGADGVVLGGDLLRW